MANSNQNQSTVGIRNLQVLADIGINPDEIGRPQPLEIDICATLHTRPFEDLDKTIDYRDILTIVTRISRQRTGLIEAFAEKVARECLALGPICQVAITIRKPQALAQGIAETRLVLS